MNLFFQRAYHIIFIRNSSEKKNVFWEASLRQTCDRETSRLRKGFFLVSRGIGFCFFPRLSVPEEGHQYASSLTHLSDSRECIYLHTIENSDSKRESGVRRLPERKRRKKKANRDVHDHLSVPDNTTDRILYTYIRKIPVCTLAFVLSFLS